MDVGLLRFVRHDLFRLSVLWHRNADAYLATGQQSGTHWLRNLLSAVISAEYGVPPLEHIDDNSIIGHPREPLRYDQIPRLKSTHHAPSPLVHSALVRPFVTFPKYVVLVRDFRASLVSRYEQRKHEFDISFSDYLRDHRLFGRHHKWDLLKRIAFFNAWGRVVELFPEQTHVVHYEVLRQDTVAELEALWRFLDLPMPAPGVFHKAVALCRKENMSRNEPPIRDRDFVRKDERDPFEWFNEQDREYFSEQCRRRLKYDFGYDFSDWTAAGRVPVRAGMFRSEARAA